MRLFTITTAFAALCCVSAVQAQEIDCDQATTQLEMNLCAQQDFQIADKALNAAYSKAVAAMKSVDANLDGNMKGAEKALREAQRAWITFRDNACAAEGYLMRGGSAEPLLVNGCLARLTDQRTADLESLALGVEG